MSNYANGYALNAQDLFENFKSRSVTFSKDGTYVQHKKKKAASIFLTCVRLVIQDIIDNNVQFKLPPVGNGASYIQMARISGDQFKRAFRAGKWRDIDFLTSDFTGYQIRYYMEHKNKPAREKNIYLYNKHKNQITEKTNQAFTY